LCLYHGEKLEGLKARKDNTGAKVAPSVALSGCGNWIRKPSAKPNRKVL
jgi:hypothetical protein